MSRFLDLFQEKLPEPQPEGYKENAIDRDGDGLVQDGTPFERPTTTKTKKKKGFTLE